jgi:hypothetical protein
VPVVCQISECAPLHPASQLIEPERRTAILSAILLRRGLNAARPRPVNSGRETDFITMGGGNMNWKNRLGVRLVVGILLLLLCSIPAAFGQSRRFMGHKEYLPYTRNLPRIDKVELLKLKLIEDRWNGDILATKVLTGADARKVASLWRRQTYTSALAACHNPAYAIKFYSQGKLLVYASVCWSCNNIFLITPQLTETQSFRGGDRRGEQLSEIFDSAFTEVR